MTEALLDTARALFCARGFAGASIDEIAGVLRCSKHTVYNRYANKLALLEAVVERDVERFRSILAQAGDGAPLQVLRVMARAYFGISASPGYAALYAAIALEAASSSHLRGRLVDWARISLEPLMQAIVAAGWPAPQADETCAILIDLLDGEANRVKWAEASGDGVEARFERRWQIFLLAAPSFTG